MMKFFTSVVTSCKDIAGKLRSIGGKANGIEFEGRQMMQHFGFISVPKAGERCLFLQFGNVVIAVASDGKDRPAVKEGETALYRAKEHYIILKDDGTIAIKAGTTTLGDYNGTMDDVCAKAVRETFCELYEKGLIYKGRRIINWCPHCRTALSDAEVEYKDMPGHFWHIRYPIEEVALFSVPTSPLVATSRFWKVRLPCANRLLARRQTWQQSSVLIGKACQSRGFPHMAVLQSFPLCRLLLLFRLVFWLQLWGVLLPAKFKSLTKNFLVPLKMF